MCFTLAKHFDRDPETNEVLWFSSPPVDVAPPVPALRHSFAYMHYLTKKRKLDKEGNSDDAMDIDQSEDGKSDRQRKRMTVSEMLDNAIASVT
jgi:chromatin structure-remodeling complex subunit RSC1/2